MTEISNEPKSGLIEEARHYINVVLKWKWVASIFFVFVLAGSTIYSFLVPRVYMATGSLWIEGQANILPFEDVQTFQAGSNLQSQARLIRSRTLAAETIEKLKLYENHDFAGKQNRRQRSTDPADPIYQERLVQAFLKNITVSSGERTRLVDVSFSNRNPKLAAEILNALFDGYIEMIVRKSNMASEQATKFLNTQIAELRTEIEERERKLNEYGSAKDILPLTVAEAPTVTRLAEINKALTEATLDKINRLNYYNQLKAAALGDIPDAPANSLIERLREQYVTLSRQYAYRLGTVRPEYPEMQRLKSELDTATAALQEETQKLVRSAHADYQAALTKEQSLQNLLNQQKDKAYSASSNSVVYNSLRIELENRKVLLESLSRRQSETDVSSQLKGLEALNVWVVDKADYPLNPSSPNKKRNVLIGFLLGLAGGIGLAIGIEFLDNTVKTSKDVTTSIRLPILGVIPSFEAEAKRGGPKGEFARLLVILSGGREIRKDKPGPGKQSGSQVEFSPHSSDPLAETPPNMKIELIVLRDPQSIQAENYRSIRTTMFVSSPPGKIKTILFTSPLAKEGKSSTVANLGATLSEAGRRVVIVDGDLRKPRQARIFGLYRGPGLSTYLSSSIDPADLVKPTSIPNLFLITSGPSPVNPVELLTSEKMDGLVAYLKREFDYILFDSPPILAVSDALITGPMVDAIILICRCGWTPKVALGQAKQKLDAHKLKCWGVILNDVSLLEQDGYHAHQYYNYIRPG